MVILSGLHVWPRPPLPVWAGWQQHPRGAAHGTDCYWGIKGNSTQNWPWSCYYAKVDIFFKFPKMFSPCCISLMLLLSLGHTVELHSLRWLEENILDSYVAISIWNVELNERKKYKWIKLIFDIGTGISMSQTIFYQLFQAMHSDRVIGLHFPDLEDSKLIEKIKKIKRKWMMLHFERMCRIPT